MRARYIYFLHKSICYRIISLKFWRTLAYYTLICTASCYKYLVSSNQPRYDSSRTLNFHKYAAESSSLPHHVLIVYSTVYCSGSLVGSRLVVTAASCFERRANESIIVKVGSTVVTGIGQVIEVLDFKVHEYFGHNTNRDNDVAILILKENVIFGENVKKIILVEPGMAVHVGTVLDVSGWGSTNLKPQFNNVLLMSDMMVINRFECNRVYPHRMTSSNFCVRYQPERKLSDNGGPAEYNDMLVGIVSSGAARSQEPYVAVLTNVSYFNRWIVLNSKKLLEKYCVNSEYQADSLNEYHSGIMSM